MLKFLNTDHRLVVSSLKLQLKSERMVPSQSMLDVGKLKDERVAEEFANRLNGDLGGLGDLGNLEGTPQLFRSPQSTQTPQILTQPVRNLLSYPLILELANIQPWLGGYHSPGFKVQLQSCYNTPVVRIEELNTPVDPAVLDHPPATINEHLVNLLCHTASVVILIPVMSLWALKPCTRLLAKSRNLVLFWFAVQSMH